MGGLGKDYKAIATALDELDRADRARRAAQVAYEAADRAVLAAVGTAVGPGPGLEDDQLALMSDSMHEQLERFAKGHGIEDVRRWKPTR